MTEIVEARLISDDIRPEDLIDQPHTRITWSDGVELVLPGIITDEQAKAIRKYGDQRFLAGAMTTQEASWNYAVERKQK